MIGRSSSPVARRVAAMSLNPHRVQSPQAAQPGPDVHTVSRGASRAASAWLTAENQLPWNAHGWVSGRKKEREREREREMVVDGCGVVVDGWGGGDGCEFSWHAQPPYQPASFVLCEPAPGIDTPVIAVSTPLRPAAVPVTSETWVGSVVVYVIS